MERAFPLPGSGTGSVREPDSQVLASMALQRVDAGGVAKMGSRYFERGFPLAGSLAGVLEALAEGGLLVVADPDRTGLRQVSLTAAGHVWLRAMCEAVELVVGGPPQPDPVRGRGPAMDWARCPADGLLHAIEPTDTEQATARGYVEALCGHCLPAEGLVVQKVPSGALCLPCVIGATADMPDPGRLGTAE